MQKSADNMTYRPIHCATMNGSAFFPMWAARPAASAIIPRMTAIGWSISSAGVSVETLLEYVTLFHQGASTIQARKNLLLEQREQIAARINELNQVLARLDWKLDGYEERMLSYEEHLK